jgi:ATPase subunit of ABC transporter with duplicated ATPase domains
MYHGTSNAGVWPVWICLKNCQSLAVAKRQKFFLAGMDIHHAQFILLDEPTNHLDGTGRQQLYDLSAPHQLQCLAVSHDRTLLNLLPVTWRIKQ